MEEEISRAGTLGLLDLVLECQQYTCMPKTDYKRHHTYYENLFQYVSRHTNPITFLVTALAGWTGPCSCTASTHERLQCKGFAHLPCTC
jgi:hypothetical protein